MLRCVIIIVWFFVFAVFPLKAATATIDSTKTYQTIEGLGGAICFYNNWVTAHPYKLEIYTNAFAGLNLSMLRLGNWFRYQGTVNFDPDAPGFVSNANRILGHPVPVYMSSWSPPAFLKSNGQVGNGGTLITNADGTFAYSQFAQYWYDSIQAYQSNGVNLTWASIQNEPDWAASYDSCLFHPTEDTVNGTNYASYSKALDAVYNKLANLTSPPKLLAPEPVHISFNDLKNYGATMNSNNFYGVAHHLYGDGGSTGDSFLGALISATNVFPSKPHFMTEYGDVTNMIECANLIHNLLVVEQVSGYNHWSLIWPGTTGGLIQIENPYASQSTWTNAPPGTPTQSHGWWFSPSYWSMKHFSYFIQPGYKRVAASDNDNNVRTSAFLSPDNLRLVVVLINTNASVSSVMTLNVGTFSVGKSSVYQTAGANKFQSLGSLTNSQVLPPLSLTTVVLDQFVNVGKAINPSPASDADNIAFNSTLSWTPGSNALTHAVYLGITSNIVAQATSDTQEFQGVFAATNFNPALLSGLTYFWRVDEITGVNTNVGAVWSFSTVTSAANFSLNASDSLNNSSFNTIGNWVTNGTANPATTSPFSGGAYNTSANTLRTPTGGNAIFSGASLKLSAGAPVASGSLLLKGPNGATVTINNLIMSGGILAQGVNSGAGGIEWVAGNINVISNSSVSGLGTTARYIGISANISGGAALSNDCNVIYSGNNIGFSGQIIVGGGGTIQIGTPKSLGGPGANLVLNNATFQPMASFAINNPGGNVTVNSGGGTFQIGTGLTLTISNPIVGAGNLLSSGGGVLQIAGTNGATGNLIASNSTLALLGKATFKNSQLGVSNNATLNVTALAVPLNISNRITLAGNLVAAINKTNFTSLLIASNLAYGGTLTLSNLGPALAYGDIIKLFSASNYSGAFSGIVPATPGPGLFWNTNMLFVDGTIFVTSTNPAQMTPPRITSFQLLGGNFTIAGTNGNAPGTLFYMLASTNLALPFANWTIIATNQFGAGGGFNFTNNYDANNPWQFFMLRLP
ncbi:MAG: hypothetical protein WDM80_10280 [Limisphaerales bacterium]